MYLYVTLFTCVNGCIYAEVPVVSAAPPPLHCVPAQFCCSLKLGTAARCDQLQTSMTVRLHR